MTIKEMSSNFSDRFSRFLVVERFLLLACLSICLVLVLFEETPLLVSALLIPANFYSATLVGLGAQFLQGLSLGLIHLTFAVLVWVFSDDYDSVAQIFYLYALCVLCGLVLLRFLLWSYVGRISAIAKKKRLHWQELTRLSFVEGLGIVSSLTDRIVVFLLMPSAAFGLYSLAITVGKTPTLLRSPLMRVFTPYLLNGQGDIAQKNARVTVALCAVIMPILFGTSVFCKWVFDVWIGGASDEVIFIARVILAGVGFHTGAVPCYYSLISLGYTNTLLKMSFWILVASALGSVVVSLYIGMQGVAVVWALSMIAVFLGCGAIMIRHLNYERRTVMTFLFTAVITSTPFLPLLF